MPNGVSGQIVQDGNILIITNVNLAQSGNYECEAKNQFGNQYDNDFAQFRAELRRTSFSMDFKGFQLILIKSKAI